MCSTANASRLQEPTRQLAACLPPAPAPLAAELIHPEEFGSFEDFMRCVQHTWDTQWADADSADFAGEGVAEMSWVRGTSCLLHRLPVWPAWACRPGIEQD